MRFLHFPWIWRRHADKVVDDPSSDAELAELDKWADESAAYVADRGFERFFKENYRKIAEVADSHPSRLEGYVDKWIHADKETEEMVKEGKRHLDIAQRPPKVQTDRVPDEPVPGVVERDGMPVKVYRDELFLNWGDTIKDNVPSFTFVPKTKVGVINIVKFAVAEGKRVRVSGSRHSWSNIYGGNGDVVISMMEISAALPLSPLGPDRNPQDNELERVQFDGSFIEDGQRHGRIRLGGAATSEHFREWALSTQGGNWEWMIRALPILTAITSSGWTQPICHGAGIMHQSVSDLCVEMEIVNCKGELQVITDKEQLKAAAGGFGLMGVIVSHVFVLDPLKIADMFPRAVPTPLAVPPIERADVPDNADFEINDFSDEQLQEATAQFYDDCNKFYAEWFWFPFQNDSWVNCWNTSEPTNERPVYPDEKEVRNQEIQLSLARIFEETALKFLPPKRQAWLTGWAAMQFLPSGSLLKTSVCDAVHFRRGIHRMPVRDCEIEIEIPPKDGKPDFSICQKAWWMAIQEVYAMLPRAPMRTTLEMRIVGDSQTTMSTQNGYEHGTCAIEVLTNTLVTDAAWASFIDRIVGRWSSLKNPNTGTPLKIRPHFAKEWPDHIRDVKIMDYLKQEYSDKIPLFKQQLQSACEEGGYQLQDALRVFGNSTILDLIDESGN